MKEYIVFIGNYGSGKTELSLNFALRAAKEGKKTALVDLDIVNPYFRSSEHTDMLKGKGIAVIAPPFANTGVDLPVVSAQVESVFAGDYDKVIFDVGGDSGGAAALGRYYYSFEKVQNLQVYFVVNIRRPLCNTSEDIFALLKQIESRSRLKVTGLINNTNLALETTWEDLADGQQVVEEAARLSGLPVAYTAGLSKVLSMFEAHSDHVAGAPYPVEIFMRPQWLDFKG